jgi:hypothetical protein
MKEARVIVMISVVFQGLGMEEGMESVEQMEL